MKYLSALNKRKFNPALAERVSNTIIKKLIPYYKDRTVIDVGGNTGYQSYFYSQYAEKVIIYEPVPELFQVLKSNLKDNTGDNFTKFDFRNLAVGNQKELITLYVDIDRLSMTSQIPLVKSQKIKVPCTTLDNEHLDDPIAYIKIDVEGFEQEVLEGAEKLINKMKPALLIEAYLPWFEKTGKNPVESFNWLKGKGYTCYSWESENLKRVNTELDFIYELTHNHSQHDGDFFYAYSTKE